MVVFSDLYLIFALFSRWWAAPTARRWSCPMAPWRRWRQRDTCPNLARPRWGWRAESSLQRAPPPPLSPLRRRQPTSSRQVSQWLCLKNTVYFSSVPDGLTKLSCRNLKFVCFVLLIISKHYLVCYFLIQFNLFSWQIFYIFVADEPPLPDR